MRPYCGRFIPHVPLCVYIIADIWTITFRYIRVSFKFAKGTDDEVANHTAERYDDHTVVCSDAVKQRTG